MDKFTAIIGTVLPVFLTLSFGVLCRSKGILSREGIDSLKKVVVNFTLPFVLLGAFASAEYTAAALILPALTFGICCVALALGYLIIRLSRLGSRIAPFLASGFEAGMLGYALFVLLFPNERLSAFALPDIGQTLFVFTLYKILLSGKTDLKAIGRDMVTTPILWAVAVGILIGATGLYGQMETLGVRHIFDGTADFLAAPTGMVILLTVGYDLVLKQIRWKQTLFLIAMRLAVMAVCYGIAVGLNRTVLDGMLFEGAMLLMVILPPPYVIPVFADDPAERVRVSSALSALTLVTMILFVVLAVVLGMR